MFCGVGQCASGRPCGSSNIAYIPVFTGVFAKAKATYPLVTRRAAFTYYGAMSDTNTSTATIRPEDHPSDPHRIENLCIKAGMRMTDQRRGIAQVLSVATDHPDVEEVYRRASKVDDKISIATVYRTVRLFEEAGILERHDFRDGRSRYEQVTEDHHDHLIDVSTGRVVEFQNDEIERLQRIVARELGYDLVDHRLELYGTPLKDKKQD